MVFFRARKIPAAEVDDVYNYILATGAEFYLLELDSHPWDELTFKYLPDGSF